MMDIGEFFRMGGYALYVWCSYGLTLLVLVINWLHPIRREKKLMYKLSKRLGNGPVSK